MTKYGDIKSIFYYCFQLPSSCRLAVFSILYRIYGLYDRPDPCRGGCLAGARPPPAAARCLYVLVLCEDFLPPWTLVKPLQKNHCFSPEIIQSAVFCLLFAKLTASAIPPASRAYPRVVRWT